MVAHRAYAGLAEAATGGLGGYPGAPRCRGGFRDGSRAARTPTRSEFPGCAAGHMMNLSLMSTKTARAWMLCSPESLYHPDGWSGSAPSVRTPPRSGCANFDGDTDPLSMLCSFERSGCYDSVRAAPSLTHGATSGHVHKIYLCLNIKPDPAEQPPCLQACRTWRG